MLLEREIIQRIAIEHAKEVSFSEIYGHFKQLYIKRHPTIVTGARNTSATANSANSIHLRYTLMESGVYYNCDVMKVGGDENRTVTIKEGDAMNVTGLLPDTTYRVGCVAYHNDEVEACLEANTTVTTRELHWKWTLQIGSFS